MTGMGNGAAGGLRNGPREADLAKQKQQELAANRKFCTSVADMYYEAAKQRDQGMSMGDAWEQWEGGSPDLDGKPENGELRIYLNLHSSPGKIRDGVKSDCVTDPKLYEDDGPS
jgi:hypothetical protein